MWDVWIILVRGYRINFVGELGVDGERRDGGRECEERSLELGGYWVVVWKFSVVEIFWYLWRFF